MSSLLALDPSSTIKNEPLETAEPSIVVTLSSCCCDCNESLPRFVNVSLPKLSDLQIVPARAIFSILYN